MTFATQEMMEDLPDYSKMDQEDGVDAKMDPVGLTEDVDFVHVPGDSQGLGWFDRRNASLSSRVDLMQLDFHKCAHDCVTGMQH